MLPKMVGENAWKPSKTELDDKKSIFAARAETEEGSAGEQPSKG